MGVEHGDMLISGEEWDDERGEKEMAIEEPEVCGCVRMLMCACVCEREKVGE